MTLPPFSGPEPVCTNIGTGLVLGGKVIEHQALSWFAVDFFEFTPDVVSPVRIGDNLAQAMACS